MVKIKINTLSEDEHVFELNEPAEEFQIEEVLLESPVNVVVVADKVSTQINLRISVTGKYTLTCDRCLNEFGSKFNTAFSMILKYDFTGELSGAENSDPDIVFIPKDQHTYDLTNDIRDNIILSIPMRIIPDEVDGKCTECGLKISDVLGNKNDNAINPVWDKLLKERKN